MEVATTNNHHSQSHHHHNHHHHHHQHNQHSRVPQLALSSTGGAGTGAGAGAVGGGSGGSGGGIVAISAGVARSPFQREVREWQRIDPETGALLTGRLEADRWINGPLNSYGKISDSQNISQPNGTQHTKRKQLEVLQARTANGSMQVIRAQTVQTTSSRWSSASASSTPSPALNSSPYHNQHSHHHHHNNNNNNHHNNHQNSHYASSHSHSPHLAETNTRWPQLNAAAAVDICEVSDDNDDDDDNDQHYVIDSGGSSSSNSSSIATIATTTVNDTASSNHFTLLNTAPSLKLSNLMKSSSSISSNNSSSNNSTIATTSTTTTAATTTTSTGTATTTTMNTHKSAGKISLHAIVGNDTKSSLSSLSSSSTTAAAATTAASLSSTSTSAASWQHQHQHQHQQQQQQRSSRVFEQPALYGSSGGSGNNRHNSLTKSSRVGVSDCEETVGGGGGGGGVADDELHRRHRRTAKNSNNDRDDDDDGDDLTPTQLNRQSRRDLESFRHYNDHGIASDHHHHQCDNDDDDDVALRLTQSHRQPIPLSSQASTPLQRSRSISTDDLSTEWNSQTGAADEPPGEWRRVSKLRRSFQSTSTASSDAYNSPKTPRRPLDLPTNSVSVSRIRAELENGRRLNTAMRNNHVDLAALDTILNGTKTPTPTPTPTPAKRTSFLTAESLKEIRGKLKKLSDESLYRDDFHAPQTLPEIEQIEVLQQQQPTRSVRQLRQLTPEQSPEIETTKSAFQTVAASKQPPVSNAVQPATNSLESRQKHKDTASSEWHLRRKSYGFEKMSPPDDKTTMFRMDASTDSGLGRSGELGGNWSPTESAAAARATVVHFGEPAKTVANTAAPVTRRYRQLKSPQETQEDELKRHSIAVDESQYVRENLRRTSQVHLTGFYDPNAETTSKSLQPPSTRFDILESSSATTSSLFQRNGQQKRVEFCKTEVHFAAESGRVNIVETDGKPPPTNNFRRRRRTTSGPLQSLVNAASTVGGTATGGSSSMPITLFGDESRRKTIATTTVAYKASLMDTPDTQPSEPSTSVTVSVPKRSETYTLTESARSIYASTSGIDTGTDCETDDISAIRGILKNKPVKPRPYHLGENFDTPDALWGVQLKPIGSGSAAAIRQDSLPNDSTGSILSSSTVAERVRIAEKRQETAQANSYSTKINLSLGESPNEWHETGVQSVTHRRPSAQELVLQDLREHQRILDEGLKSTSLIIKTMRSANEFDEAMRRLSIASMEAAVIPPIVVPTPMLRSNSYQDSTTSRRSSINSLESSQVLKSTSFTSMSSSSSISQKTSTTSTRRFCTDSFNSCEQPPPPPVAAPRMKLLGNTQIPVSQQLSQLRRLYEAATSQEDDSADEEVKSYFRSDNTDDNSDSGGGTQESSSLEDDRTVEYSSSWSRLKAKRTIWKIEADAGKYEKLLDKAELPKSNVMNIELHSPQSTLSRVGSFKKAHSPSLSTQKIIPSSHQSQQLTTTNEPIKEPLKIVKEARGARKLREHELSYFGVQVAAKNEANNEARTKSLTTMTTTSTKRTLPQRKSAETETKPNIHADLSREKNSTRWQLINDKPDLLRHSPIVVEPQIVTRTAEVKTRRSSREETAHLDSEADDDDEEHFYENITNELTPVFKVKASLAAELYDRKMDHQRDVQILSEMTRNADQTMKALSDEAAVKDQRRRSLHRHNPKPLETINEKSTAEKMINKNCIAVKVSRGTVASEARRTASRQSTPSPTTMAKGRVRTSSQSSVESCPRARSRSLSSEREYENIRVKPTVARITKHSKHAKTTPTAGSRSSSLDSHRSSHTLCSSGDEVTRREDRVRSKPKRISTAVQSRERHCREHPGTIDSTTATPSGRDAAKKSHRLSHTSDRTHASSTKHSSQRERIECGKEAVPPQRTHRRTVDATTSSRRRRLEAETHKSSGLPAIRTAAEKHERHEHMTNGSSGSRSVRSARGQEHEAVQRTPHRSERTGDKEKDKLSRSRGHSSHSSRSSTHHNERRAPGSHHMATPPKSREHKKSSSTTTTTTATTATTRSGSGEAKQHDDSLTHGKNAQIVNGHQHHGEHQRHPHIESITTTTIAAKQRETRNGKDRK